MYPCRIFLLITTLLILTPAFSQKLELTRKGPNEIRYIAGIISSPDHKYYSYSVSSYKTVLIDTNFQVIKEFNYDGMWGGGSPFFTLDNKYLSYMEFGDTPKLRIYNLLDTSKKHVDVEVTMFNKFNTSDRVLISRDGKFHLFDFNEDKLYTNVFEVGSGERSWFTSTATISPDDSFVYASTNHNQIAIYTNQDWEDPIYISSYPGEISNLITAHNSNLLFFSIDNLIVILDPKKSKSYQVITTEFSYIMSLTLDPTDRYIYVNGTAKSQVNLQRFDRKNPKKPLKFMQLKNHRVDGFFYDNFRKRLLLDVDGELQEYKIPAE